jgi:hypothetical protein
MRQFRLIFLLLAATVVFAHSVFPHHHHLEGKHSHDGVVHHHHNPDSTPDKDCEKGPHNLFTETQIDDSFLIVKAMNLPLNVGDLISIIEWQIFFPTADTKQYVIADIDIPPLLRWCSISFRGPPTV